ncbi:MAG: glycoside hydrolase family 3 N-terminal domain-containing protein [Gemmatimonadota bacterium]|nr:glycoside hydrolase family 3 N-terminal domain-containing protein [Gemmatimonadota bacterium]
MHPLARLAIRGMLGCILGVAPAWPQGALPPYRDATQPVDVRVRDLLTRMTLREKFWQLYMTPGDRDDRGNDWSAGAFGLQVGVADPPGSAARADVARAHAARVNAVQRYFTDSTRLGIPIIPFDEAVHGLMRDGATVYPAAIGLAATWDTALVTRVFDEVAAEARSRGVRQVLSPVVNIASDTRWGRVEETYGEDPYLSSAFAGVFTRAFERAGIVATPKHFVANVGDGGRDSHPIALDRRTLEEVHFPPFRAALHAGAQSVMTAYNSVDGVPATQSKWLLTDVLRTQWGFTGFVISDAAATGGATVLHYTEPDTPTAAKHAWEAGLDVVFQSSWPQHRPYLQAVEQGLVSPAVVDSAVAHVLRAKFALGLFEHPYGDPDAAAKLAGSPAHLATAREAAEEAIVLLRNERATLPLGPRVKRVAVIGVDAAEPRLGGYTAGGAATVSMLDAMRARLGASAVRYAPGPGRVAREYVPVPESALSADSAGTRASGLRGDYFDNPKLEGTPRFTRGDRTVDFGWTLNSPGRGIPFEWYSVRWTGTIRAPAGGVHRIGVEGNDGWRLWLDGKLVLDNWVKRSYGARLATVSFAPGTSHDLRLEFFETRGNARVKLVWDAGVTGDWRARIDSAVRVARVSDAAVVAVGLEEGEFRDRSTLALPGHQEELIEAVAAAGKPTVVVLVGGSAVTGGKWMERVGAVLDAWYPGEQGGVAIVRTLFGDVNPSGRLPITFAMRDGQLPLVYNHRPTGRGDDYVDGTGMPLFPFGHGLSYTTFEYSALTIAPDTLALGRAMPPGPRGGAGVPLADVPAGASVTVRARVKNTGTRPGDEVVQLYLRDLLASVARPVMQLAGFARVALAPGEAKAVAFTITPEQLSLLDVDFRRVVEPGRFRVMVGASSEDIRLRGFLVVR